MKSVIPMDSVLGVLFAAGGTAILINALGYAPIAGMVVGPGLFPTITGAGMALFGLILAVQGWLGRAAARAEPAEPLITLFAVGIVVAILVATLLMPMLGFLIAGTVFAAVIVLMSGGKWLSAIIFSPIATFAIYALFTYGFRVPLPRGLLG